MKFLKNDLFYVFNNDGCLVYSTILDKTQFTSFNSNKKDYVDYTWTNLDNIIGIISTATNSLGHSFSIIKPRVIISIPDDCTEAEKFYISEMVSIAVKPRGIFLFSDLLTFTLGYFNDVQLSNLNLLHITPRSFIKAYFSKTDVSINIQEILPIKKGIKVGYQDYFDICIIEDKDYSPIEISAKHIIRQNISEIKIKGSISCLNKIKKIEKERKKNKFLYGQFHII